MALRDESCQVHGSQQEAVLGKKKNTSPVVGHSRDSHGVGSSERKETGRVNMKFTPGKLLDSLWFMAIYNQTGDFLLVKPSQAMEVFAGNVEASSVVRRQLGTQ